MLKADISLRRQFIKSPRSKTEESGLYRNTIVSPAIYKTDMQYVFEYSYECIDRHAIVRITL